jgi:hypothetical protein
MLDLDSQHFPPFAVPWLSHDMDSCSSRALSFSLQLEQCVFLVGIISHCLTDDDPPPQGSHV